MWGAGSCPPGVREVLGGRVRGAANPGNANEQDFAVVVYNGTSGVLPVMSTQGSALAAESITPTNGAVDPGETVTMTFSFKDVGAGSTSNLVATLLATGGVTSPSAPQSYGTLTAGGPAVSQPFTFTAHRACRATITA